MTTRRKADVNPSLKRELSATRKSCISLKLKSACTSNTRCKRYVAGCLRFTKVGLSARSEQAAIKAFGMAKLARHHVMDEMEQPSGKEKLTPLHKRLMSRS